MPKRKIIKGIFIGDTKFTVTNKASYALFLATLERRAGKGFFGGSVFLKDVRREKSTSNRHQNSQ